jgi:hypothetical protein
MFAEESAGARGRQAAGTLAGLSYGYEPNRAARGWQAGHAVTPGIPGRGLGQPLAVPLADGAAGSSPPLATRWSGWVSQARTRPA